MSSVPEAARHFPSHSNPCSAFTSRLSLPTASPLDSADVAKLKEKIACLTQQLAKLQARIVVLQSTVDSYKRTITALRIDNEALKIESRAEIILPEAPSQAEIERLKREKQHVEELTSQVLSLRITKAVLEADLEKIKRENARLKHQIAALQTEVLSLRGKNDKLIAALAKASASPTSSRSTKLF